MAKKILNIATFGLAGAILGGKKKKKEEAAPTPALAEPEMPLPDDTKIRDARKKAMIRVMARRGRESTILSGDTLGGGY